MQRSARPRRRPSPFVLPRGTSGKLAGRLMARGNAPAQAEVAEFMQVRPGDRILEVGYGPGRLLRRLLDTTEATLVAGVDPSEVMFVQAQRATCAFLGSGRLDLRVGEAAHLPYPAGSFEVTVSVNSVAVWPDVEAGLREMRRVLVEGGTALVGWHSASSPRWTQRRLALRREQLDQVVQAMSSVFGNVRREDLANVLMFASQH